MALLAIPTLGLPQAVKGLTWIEDITGPEVPEGGKGPEADSG